MSFLLSCAETAQIPTTREFTQNCRAHYSLFVTMAGMMVLALFEDKIDPELADSLRKAMHLACIGNAKRHKGWYGDDMSRMHHVYSGDAG
jgi:hypothetical protein